jgi:AraC-like DNA-binding protein
MPSSEVRSFTDPDDYASVLPKTAARLNIAKRGTFKASSVLVALHDVRMQRFADNLPRVAHVTLPLGRAVISFGITAGPDQFWSGLEMSPSSILRHNDGSSSFHRSSGLASWGSMSLPVELAGWVVAMLAGQDLTPPRDPLTLTPSPTAMARLQRLHASVGRLAEDAPDLLASPEAARGIEEALIGTMVACLVPSEGRDERIARRHHAVVMQRFRALVEANCDRALYMQEVCAAIKVSNRTLRYCCHQHLGMGPKRYLMLRRMNLAHRRLCESAPGMTTVTETATRFGFWEMGRFAVGYRSIFGEMPSETLRHSAHRAAPRIDDVLAGPISGVSATSRAA